MGRVVDGRVNGAPFAGIVLTAGSVLRADDAAGPVLSKKMEDAPIAGWYTIDGGQTPEDDIIEVKRERPPRLVLVDAADMALPVGSIRLLDKRDVARKSMFTTHSLPLSILIEEIEQSCEDIVFIGIQPGDTEFYNPMLHYLPHRLPPSHSQISPVLLQSPVRPYRHIHSSHITSAACRS